ncbi:hypothetical protein [Blattabacterium cuenoti]|uniref:hypothetical protein n=1 Tax=Blattabacterium cuenoti TaxID=1653831 RepID=UPI00163CA019|nr:hypothetical protein [Blattabacterium cuenoti]
MNISAKALIPTIFIISGFILSCNDDIFSAENKEYSLPASVSMRAIRGISNTPSATRATFVSSVDNTSNNSDNTNNSEKTFHTASNFSPYYSLEFYAENNLSDQDLDKINPEELSNEIKITENQIKNIQDSYKEFFDEYHEIVSDQNKILDKIAENKKLMRVQMPGTEGELEARKNLDIQRELALERAEKIRNKGTSLGVVISTISKIRNKNNLLKLKQEIYLKRQEEKSKSKINN